MALSLKSLEAEIAAAERSVYAADARAVASGRALRDQWRSKVPTVLGGAGAFILVRRLLKRVPRLRQRLRDRDHSLRGVTGQDRDWLAQLKRFSPVVGVVPQVVTAMTALFAAFTAKDAKKAITSAAEVDLGRFAGTWYVIARLPKRGEKEFGSDSRITFQRTDNGLRLLSLSRRADGSIQRVTGRAKLRDDATQSRFKISYSSATLDPLPFVWADYTIVDVADDYSTSIVGTDDRKQLWLLAKNPVLDDSTRQDFLNKARAQGFDTTALVFTPHTDRSNSEPVQPTERQELRPA